MDMFSALADPTRRNILEILAQKGQLSATDISDKFKISPPAISQHLKILRETKLVDMEKKAQQRLYQLNPDTLATFESWIKKVTYQWEERFTIVDKILEKEKHILERR
ncbi:MAG TPA: metalloregulator ArsR/SmtB family transcription factor [Candidatus Saccharimonadales bacterium]|nr:metalloregulator ArsR/SmtB family transcription factor [Candidatus Saccharimonadales bacterium]